MNRRTVLMLASAFAGWAADKPVSDDALWNQVRRKLANDPIVKGGALEIEVKQGVVTIRGVVEQDKQKARAEKLVRKIGGVRKVENEIRVVARGVR